MPTGSGSAAACLISASAVYRPAGPEPTTATRSCFMPAVPSRLRAGHARADDAVRRPLGDRLGDLPGEVLRAEPQLVQDLAAVTVVQEPLRQPEGLGRGVHVLVAQEPAHRVAEAAGPPVVLHHGHQPV